MRSNYSFKIECDINKVDEIIQNYLKAYNFVYKQAETEAYYIYENSMKGNRCFSYYFKDGILYITAWLKGGLKSDKDIELNQNRYDFATRDYLTQLSNLFSEINNVNNGCNVNNSQISSNNFENANSNSNNQHFIDTTIKKNEKMCEWGFWLSLVGFLLSMFGFTFGILLYVFDIYLASRGLKTNKSVKAISTFVLSGASVFNLIIRLLS